MKLDIDWRGILRAAAKAAWKAVWPILAGGLAGLATGGCSITGSGIGMTL